MAGEGTHEQRVVSLIVVTAMTSCYTSPSSSPRLPATNDHRLCCISGESTGTAIAIHFVPKFADFQKFRGIVIMWSVCSMGP